MSAHVLLNLLNELGKRDEMRVIHQEGPILEPKTSINYLNFMAVFIKQLFHVCLVVYS